MKSNLNAVLLLIFIISVITPAQNFNHSLFEKLLKKNVNDKGMVDYQSFTNNKDFDKYLEQLASADTTRFNKNEKIAFYLNAYNAFTIKNVIINMPLNSPMDKKDFFKQKNFTLAGGKVSLDDVEYKLLMPLESVYIHFGLVCAAVSCPKLIKTAYTAGNVYSLLKSNAEFFLNDKSKNYLDREKKTLYLSQIFKWFRNYFEEKEGSLKNFVKKYLNDSDREYLSQNDVTISFLEYNWNLNSQK